MPSTGAGYVPVLPEAYIDSLVDTGRWRERGITHWHLCRWEKEIDNPARFTKEFVAAQITRGEPEKDPKAALRWVYRQHLEGLISGTDPVRAARQAGWHDEAAFRFSIGVSWELMTDKCRLSTPIGRGVEVHPGWSLDVYAQPMTPATCRRH